MRTMRRFSSSLALIAALLIGLWSPCRAQAQAEKMSKPQAEIQAFVGVVVKELGLEDSNQPNMDKVLLELNDYRKRKPNASAAELEAYYEILKSDHISLQNVTAFEDLLFWGTSKALQFGGVFGRKAAKWAERIGFLNDISDVVEEGRHAKSDAAAKAQGRKALEEMATKARAESRPGRPSPLAGLVTKIARDTTGKEINFDSSVAHIARQDPEFAQSPEIRYMQEHEEPDGSILLIESELREAFEAINADVHDQLLEMRGVLGEIAAQQQDILNWQLAQEEQARRAAQARAFEEFLGKADIAVDGISSLLHFLDPKLAGDARVAGKATIQFAKGVNDLIKAVSDPDAGLFSFASAAATGNIIGAALQIFSLFGSSGPGPDQMILDGIDDLKVQIEGLRQEMHQRFDRIETRLDQIEGKLNQILGELETRFNRIDFNLGLLIDNVEDIQITLVGLQADLNRIEKNLFAFLSDVDRTPLKLAINGWLGYHERTGMDMTYAEYSNANIGPENIFWTWATDKSDDFLYAGENSRNYNDNSVLTELTTYPLHFNINYLAQFPAQRFGLPGLVGPTTRLPNPRDWAASADAYRILAQENRRYDQLINPARLDAIYNTGAALKAALRNITVKGSGANYDLFNALHANYNSKLEPVQQELQKIEDTYYKTSNNKLLLDDNPTNYPANKALDIFRGANQRINYTPGVSEIAYARGTGQPLSQDGILTRFYIPEPFVIADYMTWKAMPNANFGRVSLQANTTIQDRFHEDANWRDYWETSGDNLLGPESNLYQYFKDKIRYIQVKMTIGLIWQGITLQVRSVTFPEIEAHRYRYYTRASAYPASLYEREVFRSLIHTDLPAWVRSEWESFLRPLFISSSTEESPSDAERLQRNFIQLQVGTGVERRLREHQVALYNNILNVLNATPDNDLKNRAKELTGAKELWIAYVALGMSRSLERNEQLRGLLFGNQSLLDIRNPITPPAPSVGTIKRFYEDAIQLLLRGENVPKVEVYSFEEGRKAVGQQRADALHSLLTGYLDKIRDHELTESLELVEVTLLQLDLFRKTRYNPTIAEVTPSISITREVPRFNRNTVSYTQRITLRNTSNVALAGPITLTFDKVGSNPTPRLALPDGQTLFFSLSTNNHSPYVYVGAGEDNLLSPGETAMITVELLPSVRAKLPPYNNRVLAGDGEQ